MGIKGIIMPENFITMFKAPDKDEAKNYFPGNKTFIISGKRINEKIN